MAPPTCFLRQPSLEETSGQLLLLLGSPFTCPVCTAELLLSFPLNDLSAHMEIPVQAQPSLPCKYHALCMLSCSLLPPSWTNLAPLLSPSTAASWQWHVRSLAEGLAHSCAHSRVAQGIRRQWCLEDRSTMYQTAPSPTLPALWLLQSSPGHQGTAGDTETCPSLLPTRPSSTLSPPSPVVWWRVHSTACADPRALIHTLLSSSQSQGDQGREK